MATFFLRVVEYWDGDGDGMQVWTESERDLLTLGLG